ncbi:MAG: NfeD family protein [bacterium]
MSIGLYSKRIAILTLLTLIFIFDDVLLYLLLKNIFEWQIDFYLLSLATAVVLALNLSLAWLVYKIMRKQPRTGQQGMIGKIGVVREKIKGVGKIRVQGEIWQAESAEVIKAGEKVVVEKVEGLTLFVNKIDYPKQEN